MTISRATRQRVRQRANSLCEYCHSAEEGSTALFTFDHIIPQSLNGSDDEDNLALACTRCNGRRYNFMDGIDPDTQTTQRLFNPRQDHWTDHFIWNHDGQKIIGISPMGRATINRLDINDDRHDDGSIRRARRLWMRGGWHPPNHDPQQQ
ncbi:HNH endonuclease [Phormidesmis priestleyi ULC007]|uniref:HNH endonuclease n=1 Tax=Phormidesmis priestleyi ULC007 TaxID=1920490 RepID=A0A2T1DM62_9CYAN|nr:HNH endonuclease signature motif containing protein [Phormidesmis priestleyi]PSB21597.1 HNH endonuclease [Phormidesmis priestleyi ULC007]PZO54638.1 MAG: HNH endonuclease [Phormidesmis priestleyi]